MADQEDIEELKQELRKLRPGQKLKRLKEFEEKRKLEVGQIEDLIKASEKELKTEKFAEEIAPKQQEINIKNLFEEEGNRLEITAKREGPSEEGRSRAQYDSFRQVYNDYAELQGIAYASMTGNLTSTHKEAIDEIGERLDRTKYESSSAEIANLLVASRATLYKIRKYAGVEGRGNY